MGWRGGEKEEIFVAKANEIVTAPLAETGLLRATPGSLEMGVMAARHRQHEADSLLWCGGLHGRRQRGAKGWRNGKQWAGCYFWGLEGVAS
jgi:hypothetical protein